MMNNIVRQFKWFLPQRKQGFSKLLHFCQNYPIYEFDLSKFVINRFQALLDGAVEGNSHRFNVQLTKYMNTNDYTENEQLYKLLKTMYENNIHCSKLNKDWFIEFFKQRHSQLNSDSIDLLLHYQLIGISSQEITNHLVQEFKVVNIQNITFSDRLSLAFLFGSLIKKNYIDTKCNQFKQKWAQLMTFLIMDINSQDNSYLTKYQYIAQVIKNINSNDNKDIVDDLKFLFERLTQNFKLHSPFHLMPTKDTAILLTCCLKIKENMLNEEMSLIIYNLLMFLQKTEFNEFNNVSLYTIILSLSSLPDFQKQIGENIVQILNKRIQMNGCLPKYYLGSFAEIYQRWEVPLPRDHLTDMIQYANVSEFCETDLANYLQLLTLLPIETIISTLNNIEKPLYQKYLKKKDLWPNRQDQSSIERIKRMLTRFNSMANYNSRKIDSIERLTKLIQ